MSLDDTMTHRRLILVAVILFAGFYAGGYFYVRSQHFLVHYGRTNEHRIDVGDLGFDLPELGAFNPSIARACYWIFLPMRWLELGYWYGRDVFVE